MSSQQWPRPRRQTRRAGWGCVLIGLILCVGAAAVAIFFGPRLLNQLTFRAGAVPLVLNTERAEQLAAQREQAVAQLNGYGWVDQEAGVVHIPIQQAMTLLAETGLPVGAPTAAPETAATDGAPDLTDVNYEEHVLPIFQERCSECHGDDNPDEGLQLTTYKGVMAGSFYGSVVKPGDPEGSYLVEMVVTGKMPKRGPDLSQAEIDTIIAWIEAGAPEKGSGTTETAATAPISDTAAVTATAELSAPVDLANVSFQTHILPIFLEHCSECHGDDNPEEGLQLTSYKTVMAGSIYGSVIEPGDPEGSYLVKMVVTGKMPKRGPDLTQEQVEIISAWVKAGALDN